MNVLILSTEKPGSNDHTSSNEHPRTQSGIPEYPLKSLQEGAQDFWRKGWHGGLYKVNGEPRVLPECMEKIKSCHIVAK